MKYRILLFLLLAMSQLGALAQETADNKTWNFLIEPYLMFPKMSGETGIHELPLINVDADASQIFSNLEFRVWGYTIS